MKMQKQKKKGGMLFSLFSFDDTHYLNSKCSDLLDKYSLKATFYMDTLRISPRLGEDVKRISEFNEIGSHSITHRDLTKLSLEEVIHECVKSKETLEKLTGKPVTSFAYPYGRVNAEVINVVRNYYHNARGTREGRISIDNDIFRLGITFNASSHGYKGTFRLSKSLKLYRLLFRPDLISGARKDWLMLAASLIDRFDKEVEEGESRVFHLMLHADHIEARSEWNKLEEIFNRVSSLNKSKNLTVTEYANECKSYFESVSDPKLLT